MTSLNIAILGAGVTGLSAAWDLAQAGHSVTVYEAQGQPGGLASGFRDDNWDWSLEKFYHHWFEGDEALIDLAEEIGIDDKVFFRHGKTSMWLEGDIVRSEIEPTSVLKLPISFRGLIPFALSGAYLKLTPFWKPLERVTADRWMRAYMGSEAYEKLFRPMLIGKFSDAYDRVNMAWMWARIRARSLKLGTMEGGFQAFMDALAAAVEAKGVTIHYNQPIDRVEYDGVEDRVRIVVDGQEQLVDQLLATVSPLQMLRLTPQLVDTDYGEVMQSLESMGGLCVILALRHSLLTDGTYWLNLPAESPDKSDNAFPFVALVEHTNWQDSEHYGGDHIIYMGDYVAPTHRYFSMSDDELTAEFLPSLKQVNPNFDPGWIRRAWVYRAPYAQPVPGINHSEKILPLRTPVPDVYWASMSQVYPWDRGTNFSVELGRRAARQMMQPAGMYL